MGHSPMLSHLRRQMAKKKRPKKWSYINLANKSSTSLISPVTSYTLLPKW